MSDIKSVSLLVFLLSLVPFADAADTVSRERIKGLDEQVQDIKTDVLAISTELLQLEETLIYPSGTQVSVFVSMAPDSDERLDAVDIRINGKGVMHHVYTHKELDALRSGGVQRIYTGNVPTGEHQLEVVLSAGKGDSKKAVHTFQKETGPSLVEVTLFGGEPIQFKDR